jgi:hypothetical protein
MCRPPLETPVVSISYIPRIITAWVMQGDLQTMSGFYPIIFRLTGLFLLVMVKGPEFPEFWGARLSMSEVCWRSGRTEKRALSANQRFFRQRFGTKEHLRDFCNETGLEMAEKRFLSGEERIFSSIQGKTHL